MPAPAPAPLSELEIAEAAVKAADQRIAAVSEELRELTERYQIRVDRNGRIAQAIVPRTEFRAELENMVRANLRDRDKALTEFYRCLSIYAGLKGTT